MLLNTNKVRTVASPSGGGGETVAETGLQEAGEGERNEKAISYRCDLLNWKDYQGSAG